MGKLRRPQNLELIPFAGSPHNAAEIAKAVHRDHSRFVERRCKKGAGQMRAMVFHELELGFADAR